MQLEWTDGTKVTMRTNHIHSNHRISTTIRSCDSMKLTLDQNNLSICTQLKAKIVKEDFTGLPSNIWNRLEIDLKECYNWNGEFQKKKRKKREVGEVGELGEEVGQADASNLLNWAKELLPGCVCIERKPFSGFIFLLDISNSYIQ